jgi:hypothetical protein
MVRSNSRSFTSGSALRRRMPRPVLSFSSVISFFLCLVYYVN